ncbi:hypothetical protein E4A51_17980 [Cellulomonas sp. HD19AZ1]|nr:hypothetical protein E4A51_17980 [Cellulomonas sp. HD19AZ1]
MTLRNETGLDGRSTCRFPGCTRATEPGDGRGRPPAYCDDPAHNRAAAYRARRGAEPGDQQGSKSEGTGEPAVVVVRERAATLVERFEAAAMAMAATATGVVEELRTLGEVAAVEVELESVTAAAEQRAAQARSDAAEAERRRRRAEAAAAEADQLRADAEAAAEEALTAEQHARSAALAAEREATRAHEDVERLAANVAALTHERDAALAQARRLADDLTAAQALVDQARGERERMCADMDERERRILDLEAERAAARQEVTALAARLDEVRALYATLNSPGPHRTTRPDQGEHA